MFDGLSDEDLMNHVRVDGEPRAFEQLWHRHFRGILAASLRFTGNLHEAEDLTSATFLTALSKANLFRPRGAGSFRAWLWEISRHTCLNHLKAKAARCRRELDLEGLERQPEEPATAESAAVFRSLIARLPKEQRIALKLRVQGYSYLDIAGLTGYSEALVRSHIENGRKNLRKAMNAEPETVR